MATNVQQLAGGRIEGLEHCPPLYHFDLSEDELYEFVRNPESTLNRLDVPVPKPLSIVLARWDDAFSEIEGWQSVGAEHNLRGCCYTTDGGMICHRH